MSASSTYPCWTCPQKNRPCIQQTYRKENWPTCQAASKGLGFPIFPSAEKCQKYCTTGGKKPIDLAPVCWSCDPNDTTCKSFLGDPVQGCPKTESVYLTKEACMSGCPFHHLVPPIEHVIPIEHHRMWMYVLAVVIILVLLALIVGAVFYFA